MRKSGFNRRDFNRLTAAAFGGMVTGSLAGCGKKTDSTPEAGGTQVTAAVHVCRGLNDCTGQGAAGKNECRGAGTCATSKSDGPELNACKGQGGCGEVPGTNDCEGKGGCGVPLTGGMWDAARKHFEETSQAASKEFLTAPAES